MRRGFASLRSLSIACVPIAAAKRLGDPGGWRIFPFALR